jgi:hypothetical protein
VAASLLVTCAALSGCGEDSREGQSDDAPSTSATVASTTAAATECEQALSATYPDGSTVALDTSAAAVRLGDGAAYTHYAGDYEIPTDNIGRETVEPPAGQHQATVFITVHNAQTEQPPIEPGTEIEYTAESDVLTFGVVVYAGSEQFGEALDARGRVTVENVDESAICVSVDYTDAQKSVEGQISAPVFDSGF